MTSGKGTEGPCAPLFYGAIVLIALATLPVSAQTVERSDLELCVGLESSALKLACFEAIIAASKTSDGQAHEDAGQMNPVSVETEIEVRPVEVIAPIASQRTAATLTEEVPLRSDFGQEDLDQSDTEEKEIIKAVVSEVTEGRNKVLYFHLTNGHTWRQIEGRYYPYPKSREFDVEITRGGMGEYRMRVDGVGRMVKIRRVK